MRYKPGDLKNKKYVEEIEKVQRRDTKIYDVFQLRLSSARHYNTTTVINIAKILTDDKKINKSQQNNFKWPCSH